MSVDFIKLKEAITEVNTKFPNRISLLDKNRSELAQEFVHIVSTMSDEDAEKLNAETIILFNTMVDNPNKQAEPTEAAPPVTVTKAEVTKNRKSAPLRVNEPNKQRKRKDPTLKFRMSSISHTARITVLCVENPEMTSSQILSLMVAEGRTIARSTLDVEYACCHKTMAYLGMKGLLNFEYYKPDSKPESDD